MEELKIKKGIFHSFNTPNQSNISFSTLNVPNKILGGQHNAVYVNQIFTDISIG